MPKGVMPYAVDPEAAERLWRLSEQLVCRSRRWPASNGTRVKGWAEVVAKPI
jgi:hypothetical protein